MHKEIMDKFEEKFAERRDNMLYIKLNVDIADIVNFFSNEIKNMENKSG